MIDGVAELARNRWPNSTEMGGRFDPKWVAEFNRNTQGLALDLAHDFLGVPVISHGTLLGSEQITRSVH